MNTYPKVVGFVPAYRAEKFILKTLEALAGQDYPNFEIIVCDDCSPDRTAAVCEDFCKRDPRFRFVKNDRNLGWAKTTELLWLQAAQDSAYCFTNSHDDQRYPDYISTLVNLLEARPHACLAIPGMENSYVDRSLSSFYREASDITDPVERCFQIAKKDKDHWWAGYQGLHRSEAVRKVFPIKRLPFGEREFSLDLILMLKMAFHGSFVTSDRVLFKKVYLQSSVSSGWKHGAKNRAALWAAIFREIRNAPLTKAQRRTLQTKLLSLLFARLSRRIAPLSK